MITSFKSFFHNLLMHPLRGVLTIVTITIGVATLIISTSLNLDINRVLSSSSAEYGYPIVIANGVLNDAGNLQPQRPSDFTPDIDTVLKNGYENIFDITIVSDAWVRSNISVNNTSYQIRSVVQTNENYASLMGLEMINGVFFSKEDIDNRIPVIVISSLSAKLLYGSAEAAIGETIRFLTKDGEIPYSILGVYNDVSDLERQLYGIGDFIFPLATGTPIGANFHPIQFGAVVMGRVVNDSVLKAESRIRSLLEQEYGDDVQVSVWEGSASGPTTLLEEGRDSVRNFAIAVNILGIIILAISSIGIFSIMLVEVLNRTREIGLRRSMGTTKAGIRKFFMIQAAYYSLCGSILGIGVSLIFYRTIGTFLTPLFDSSGLRVTDLHLALPNVIALLVAVGASLVFGVLFGFFPAMSAAKTPIAECIREDAV
ncbi:MAG: ABC transporter permease [Spirochaetales bacterium]|nr:ABC transporter permease [Spirochaetales bacterium]